MDGQEPTCRQDAGSVGGARDGQGWPGADGQVPSIPKSPCPPFFRLILSFLQVSILIIGIDPLLANRWAGGFRGRWVANARSGRCAWMHECRRGHGWPGADLPAGGRERRRGQDGQEPTVKSRRVLIKNKCSDSVPSIMINGTSPNPTRLIRPINREPWDRIRTILLT